MKPEISEFSYGFALTNELVGLLSLSVAPIFPSLIEEGKVGGGYDVKLGSPGIPLFVQFKRSDWMTRCSAKEYKTVNENGGQLKVPYYRFPITDSSLSKQHAMLRELDNGPNLVLYAAPRFHTLGEINDAWNASAIGSRSFFVSPTEIGPVDSGRHTVSFDDSSAWLCSEPRRIRGVNFQEHLHQSLLADTTPLKVRLDSLLGQLRLAERRGRILSRQRPARKVGFYGEEDAPSGSVTSYLLAEPPKEFGTLDWDTSKPLETRRPKPLNEYSTILRKAADIAARVFDTQLLIVQSIY